MLWSIELILVSNLKLLILIIYYHYSKHILTGTSSTGKCWGKWESITSRFQQFYSICIRRTEGSQWTRRTQHYQHAIYLELIHSALTFFCNPTQLIRIMWNTVYNKKIISGFLWHVFLLPINLFLKSVKGNWFYLLISCVLFNITWHWNYIRWTNG
jgi:hypothetical protein